HPRGPLHAWLHGRLSRTARDRLGAGPVGRHVDDRVGARIPASRRRGPHRPGGLRGAEAARSGGRPRRRRRQGGVVSQFETMATQSPPIHRAGGAGGAVGNPIRTVWPTARLSVAGTPVTTYDDGFPKAPPALSAVPKVGSTTR